LLKCRKTVAFVTLGSLGDLHPCLALGEELKRRGYDVRIITTEFYRKKVERLGLDFRAMRPDWDPTSTALIAQCDDLRKGPEILFRRIILPHLRHTYEDLSLAIEGADLMVAGELVYAAPLVAERLGLRWASLILSPCSFLSVYDPPLMVNAPWLLAVRRTGLLPYRALFNLARFGTNHWWNPVRQLRASEGLRSSCDPILKDKFSPDLVLALFSTWLAQSQPDWPKQTAQPGFVFHDGAGTEYVDHPDLKKLFDSNLPPLVFTLGSTALGYPGNFYRTSIEVIRRLGASAVLIGATQESEWINPTILSLPYVPYSRVFPRASVIVHQGGSGTTAQALKSGRPMLFVPWGWDQPDNAMRAERRGSALSIRKDQYSVNRATVAIDRLRTEETFSRSAVAAATHVRQEQGLAEAADCIMRLLC
jgi:rhamnosyltransferase subunit B